MRGFQLHDVALLLGHACPRTLGPIQLGLSGQEWAK